MSLQSPTEVLDVVTGILKEECGVTRAIELETRLLDDLGLDSVGMLALAIGLENHYRVVLEEDPEQPPVTVGDLVQLVEKRMRPS